MHANALGIGFGDFDPGIFNRFDPSGNAQVYKSVGTPDFFVAEIHRRVKILNLAGDLGRKGRWIEGGDTRNAAAPTTDPCPVLVLADTERRYDTQAGDCNATFPGQAA